MMGDRHAAQAALFYEFSLETHVPTGHLLRSIDRFVELDGLRRELAPFYSDIGRPSVDPELMIRMLIVGYCFGIRSERRLCEEVHLNLAYRWFCRLGLDGSVPDHSTFSKNRHGRFRESDLLRRLFETVLQRCIDEGLVGGEGFAVDASLIQADAIESGEHRLFYDVIDMVEPWSASPQTILFHHGIGAESGIWAEWVHALASRYRIVRFDMRGFGRSDVPAADYPWSIDRLADDVLAVASATGMQRFHFVGESIGGTIGLYAALKYPERFISLTMCNAGHVGGSIHKVETWRRIIDERGMAGWSDDFMADRFHPGALAPERWDWYARQQAADDRNAVLNALAVLVGMDLSADLRSIRVPVLILHPDASPFIPVAVAAQLHAGLPDAELHVIGHAKHGLPFSHGRQCATILGDFLNRRFADPES